MHRRPLLTTLALALTLTLGLALLAQAPLQAQAKTTTYKVTITNLTHGQVLSPPVVISHDRHFSLYRLGSPASPELAAEAEDADSGPLAASLADDPDVLDVAIADAPLPPGHSVTLEVELGFPFDLTDVVGMLVTTNDAFYAVTDAAMPFRRMRDVHEADAYDAGSEANNESCTFIPGPPCGNAGVRDTAGAEGFVYVHSGIHGVGDLDPATFDWRNPVALVAIQRKE